MIDKNNAPEGSIADKENKIFQIIAEEINGRCLAGRIVTYGELRPIAKRIVKELTC